MPAQLQTEVRDWEASQWATPREKLMARYLYEHLFLAHLYFTSEPPSQHPAFFRLVRSHTPCETGIDEIATRRPYDEPGRGDFRYCLRPFNEAIVDKTHIPYDLSRELRRCGAFLEPHRTCRTCRATRRTASNPFISFDQIPARSRYQYLLDDAQYFVMTFIRGPVCRGQVAVDVIEDQIFVAFLRPQP